MDPNMKVGVPKGAVIAPIQIKGEQTQLHVDRHAAKLTKNTGDCGIDLFPLGIDRIEEIESRGKAMFGKSIPWVIFYVSTGVRMTICAGAFIFVTSRSSTAKIVPSAESMTGIIDAGYTGELLCRFKCHGSFRDETAAYINDAIEKKIALAQAIPMQFCYPQFIVVTEGNIIVPPGMGRGDAGFGSTNGAP